MLLAMSSRDEADHEQYRQRAATAFRQALKLTPKNASVWIANVQLARQEQGADTPIGPILAELSQRVEMDEPSRAFVFAQIHEELEQPLQAQNYYRQAMELIDREGNSSTLVSILGRAAQFYSERVTILAERYAREALASDADAIVPRQVLLEVLAQSDQSEAVEEALTLLEFSPTSDFTWNVDFHRRTQARLLHQQGKPTGVMQATSLLETLLQKTTADNRLLASLYEHQERLGPAFEILSQLASSSSARPGDAAVFLDFWQRNFLAKTVGQQRPKFYSLAGKVYRQLRQVPAQQAEWLRWKTRELKLTQKAEQLSWPDVETLVAELVTTNRKLTHWREDAKLAWCRSLLRVLIEEKMPSSALQLVKEPLAGLTDADVAIVLCHAMIVTSTSGEPNEELNAFLQTCRAGHLQRADLARAVGDYQLMTGQYELAVDAYREALAIEPSHKLASNNLALSLAELPGKLTEAQAVLETALEENGSDPVLLDTRAVLELLDQRASDAIDSLEQVLSASPEDATARIHAAMGYQALGKQDLMRASLLDAIVLGVNQSLLSPRDREFFLEMSPQVTASQR